MVESSRKTTRYSRRRIVEMPAPSQQLPVLTGEVLPPLAKKNGRPFAIPGPEKDKASYAGAIKTLRGLGEIMATSKECAAVLDISEKTLFTFFSAPPRSSRRLGERQRVRQAIAAPQAVKARRNERDDGHLPWAELPRPKGPEARGRADQHAGKRASHDCSVRGE